MIEGTPIRYARVGDIPDMMTELWSAPRSSRLRLSSKRTSQGADNGQRTARASNIAELDVS